MQEIDHNSQECPHGQNRLTKDFYLKSHDWKSVGSPHLNSFFIFLSYRTYALQRESEKSQRGLKELLVHMWLHEHYSQQWKGGSNSGVYEEQMDEQIVVIAYNGLLLNLQREGHSVTCYSIDGLWGYYVKWNKRQRGSPYDFTYTRPLEPSDSQRQKAVWWLSGWKGAESEGVV